MAKKVTHKPPSRERYEKSHPTVSCRVPKELYDQLARIKNREEKSFADILKSGLEKIDSFKKQLSEMSKKSYDEGYQKGYTDAEGLYKVMYHCYKCKQPMVVDRSEEKVVIDRFMSEKWAHDQCQSMVVRIPNSTIRIKTTIT
jgi:hypothetical protein